MPDAHVQQVRAGQDENEHEVALRDVLHKQEMETAMSFNTIERGRQCAMTFWRSAFF